MGVASLALAPAAEAATTLTRYNVIQVTKKYSATGGQFASCKITSTGGTCTITSGKLVARTVQASLGYTQSGVSAGLNISQATTVTTTVSCSSPALKAGQVWRARAVGTQYNYKIQQQRGTKPRIGGTTWTTVATSGALTAFDPYTQDISCGL